MATLGSLMGTHKGSWGLRGDPVLWDAMAEAFANQPMPKSEAALREAFDTAFETLTDHPLNGASDRIKVAWARRENGGMSNGMVDRGFWRDTAWPELLGRYRECQK